MAISTWGAERLVNTTASGNQRESSLARLSDGSYVSVWTTSDFNASDPSSDIFLQRFDTTGQPIGPETRITTQDGVSELGGKVTALSDGGFIVSYVRAAAALNADIYVARYDASGRLVGSGTVDDTPDDTQTSLSVTVGRGYAVAYANGRGDVINFNAYDSEGVLVGQSVISWNITGSQTVQSITELLNGNVVVVMKESGSYRGQSPYLFAQIVDPLGHPVGRNIFIGTSYFGSAAVTTIDSGGFAIAWIDNPSSTVTTLRTQFFSIDGTPSTAALDLAGIDGSSVSNPAITHVSGGRSLVSWTGRDGSGTAVYAQVVGDAGTGTLISYGPAIRVGAGTYDISPLTTLADGRVVVTWTDTSRTGADDSGTAIHQQILDPRDGYVQGTYRDDLIYGSLTSATVMVGYDGNDTFYGGQAADTILGGAGNDTIHGGGGNDLIDAGTGQRNDLYGGAGDDNYVVRWPSDLVHEMGGEGFDTIYVDDGSYSVQLSATNVEALVVRTAGSVGTGTDGADLLKTEANDVSLLGGHGDDTLIAYGLRDQLYGSFGNDAYVVNNRTIRVLEADGEGIDTIYADGTDFSLMDAANVEGLVIRSHGHIGAGTAGSDFLQASADNVQLFGGGGNDTLVARGRADILYGSIGDDVYVANTRDVIIREAISEGMDAIYADNTDFSLADAANVENLVLRGDNHVGAGTNNTDLLVSAGANNHLFGGEGTDVFSMTAARGATRMLDFDARPGERDLIAFATSQFSDFAAVQARLSQVGSDAVITADNGFDSYVLVNVTAASLTASDFMFV